MSLTSNDETVRNLAAAIGQGISIAGLEQAGALEPLKQALQIPTHGLRRAVVPAMPDAGADMPTNALDDRDIELDNEHTDTAGTGDFTQIDLLAETVRLYRQTRRLLSKVLNDTKTPVNQQAQTINALQNILKSLSNQQTDLYNAERLKRLEMVITETVRDLAPEVQDEFLRRYEEEVKQITGSRV